MKDAAFIRRLGAETSTPTPIIDQAWNHLTAAKAIGGESLDWSACAAGMRVTAGLPPFKGEDFSLALKTDGHTNGEIIEPRPGIMSAGNEYVPSKQTGMSNGIVTSELQQELMLNSVATEKAQVAPNGAASEQLINSQDLADAAS